MAHQKDLDAESPSFTLSLAVSDTLVCIVADLFRNPTTATNCHNGKGRECCLSLSCIRPFW
jgi:hypothetical protein